MDHDKLGVESLFSGLGLGRAEGLTYAALLQHGSVSIRKLADATGINRGTTYEALKRLTSAGLVSVRQQANREHFTAESPDKILALIDDKRHELTALNATAKTLIPRLLSKRKSGFQPIVKYYQDDEGVVAILRDVLETCRHLKNPEYYSYSSLPIRRYLYRRFPLFTVRRIAEKIRVKVISVGEGGEEAALSERKWLQQPSEAVTSSYTLIYGNKVATISITPEDIPYGVIIEDEGAASLQRLVFEQLWSYL